MGQQQIFLMILAAIIIVITIMAGADQFGRDASAAMQDEMRKAILDIAVRAQAWYRSPAGFGGGHSFLDFSLATIHCDSSSVIGNVKLTNKLPDSFRITGALHNDSNWNLIVDVYSDSFAVAQ